jgi:ADP-ribose pyrophosphatase
MGKSMQSWKTLSRRTILDHSKYLVVEGHVVELPDGRIIKEWPWIITPDYVNVAAVTGEGKFLCFRQTKYGVEGTSLAPVGGYLEPDEDPLAGAQRELLEETGYKAAEWINLGSYMVDGNRGAGKANLFMATDAFEVETIRSDDLEEQRLVQLTGIEVDDALRTGEFKVLAWSLVMALALRHLRGKESDKMKKAGNDK